MTNLQKFGYASIASLLTATQTFAAIDFGSSTSAQANLNNEAGLTLPQIVQNYVAYALGFITLIAVVYALWAGWNIMTAGGDEEKVKKGRTTIIQISIGIIVMWLAYSVVSFVIGAIATA